MSVTVDFQLAIDSTDDLPKLEDFERWANTALVDVEEDCELSIRLVNNDESAELNETYRGKAAPTNVLSFPFESPIPLDPLLLGDLVLCVPVVVREAAQQQKALQDHWAHLVIHGCLHLLGYDHIDPVEADEMEAIEIEMLQTLNIDNPYIDKGLNDE